MPGNHKFQDFWLNLTPGTVFFAFPVVLLLIVLFKLALEYCKCFKCCTKLPKRVKHIQVIQELENFYSALPTKMRESIIREEVLGTLRTSTQKFDKDMLKDLVMLPGIKDQKLSLKGPPSFRILRTPIAEDFGYV